MITMFEKSEIINALKIAKERNLDNKILGLFSKFTILNIVNKNRWKQGASINFGFMTEQQFERIIQNRKFFSTIDKIGIKG